jgi:hypothetical protein
MTAEQLDEHLHDAELDLDNVVSGDGLVTVSGHFAATALGRPRK